MMNSAMGSNNECPTSSPIETDFDVLKNYLFNGCNGIRVDSFIKKHLIFTKGRLICKRAKEVRNELFESTDQSNDAQFQNFESQKTDFGKVTSQKAETELVKVTVQKESDTSTESVSLSLSLSVSFEKSVSINSDESMNTSN